MMNTAGRKARPRGPRLCRRARAGARSGDRPAAAGAADRLRHAPSSGIEARRDRRGARPGRRHGQAAAARRRAPAAARAERTRTSRREGAHDAATLQAAGTIELYFYGELAAGRAGRGPGAHAPAVPSAAHALEELSVIRAALAGAARRRHAAGRRLVRVHGAAQHADCPATVRPRRTPRRRHVVAISLAPPGRAYLAAAALLALVTTRRAAEAAARRDAPDDRHVAVGRARGGAGRPAVARRRAGDPGHDRDPALSAVSEQHFERSKLVVLGLATKDATRRPTGPTSASSPGRC